MTETKFVTLKKDEIKRALTAHALARLGIDAQTPGLQTHARLGELIDVLPSHDCTASIRITVPTE